MFESFFPRPRIFFLSALLWAAISIALWYIFGADIGRAIGFVGIAHIMVFENVEGAAFAQEVAVFTLCFFE